MHIEIEIIVKHTLGTYNVIQSDRFAKHSKRFSSCLLKSMYCFYFCNQSLPPIPFAHQICHNIQFFIPFPCGLFVYCGSVLVVLYSAIVIGGGESSKIDSNQYDWISLLPLVQLFYSFFPLSLFWYLCALQLG